jgi:hypothetical protein
LISKLPNQGLDRSLHIRKSNLQRLIIRLGSEHLERMLTVVSHERRKTPQHAEGLQRSRGDDWAAVVRFPSELAKDSGDFRPGFLVVAAIEHGRCSLREFGIDHQGIADAIEGLDVEIKG